MRNYNTPTLKRELGNYISGYVDGEGCFSVSFSQREKLRIGWEVKSSFAVGQNYDRREVLDLMMEYFNCGSMRRAYADKTLKYEVRSLQELLEKISSQIFKTKRFSSFCGDLRKNETERTSYCRRIQKNSPTSI